MAVEWMDSFAQYRTGLTGTAFIEEIARGGWIPLNSPQLTSGSGRFGGAAIVLSESIFTSLIQSMTVGVSAVAQRIIGFSMRFELAGIMSTNSAFRHILQLRDSISSVAHIAIAINENFSLSVLCGTNVLGTTSAGVIQNSAWHHIELSATVNNASGGYTLRVDGVQVLTASSIDTQNGGLAQWDAVRFVGVGATSGTADLTISDPYLILPTGNAPTSFIGDSRITVLTPDSDVSVQWTRDSGATNAARVAVLPYSPSAYVESSTVGHIDRYGVSNLTVTPVTIHAVGVVSHLRKTDAGSRTARNKLKSSATTVDGVTRAPNITGTFFTDIYELNPNTTTAWTKATVDAIEIGVEIVA